MSLIPGKYRTQRDQARVSAAYVTASRGACCWREIQHVNLKVVDEDGIEVYFKCQANRPLGKLMNAYCNRLPQSRDGVRFMEGGEDRGADLAGLVLDEGVVPRQR